MTVLVDDDVAEIVVSDGLRVEVFFAVSFLLELPRTFLDFSGGIGGTTARRRENVVCEYFRCFSNTVKESHCSGSCCVAAQVIITMIIIVCNNGLAIFSLFLGRILDFTFVSEETS